MTLLAKFSASYSAIKIYRISLPSLAWTNFLTRINRLWAIPDVPEVCAFICKAAKHNGKLLVNPELYETILIRNPNTLINIRMKFILVFAQRQTEKHPCYPIPSPS